MSEWVSDMVQPRDWQPKFFSDADPTEVENALPMFHDEPVEVSVGRLRTVRAVALALAIVIVNTTIRV